MRMSTLRFTRLTNAFSNKVENHAAAGALYFMYDNFSRVHQTLRVTPAMEAVIADRVWSIEDLVALLWEARARARVRRLATPAGGKNSKERSRKSSGRPALSQRAARPSGQKAGSWKTNGRR
jgi:hypothetical protein